MIEVEGYEFEETILRHEDSKIYSGHRIADGLPIIARVSSAIRLSHEDKKRFQNHQTLVKELGLTEIINLLEVVEAGSDVVKIMENPQAVPLALHIKDKTMEIPLFMKFAINMAEVLSKIHHRSILHRNLNPGIIFINPENGDIKLCGFEYACHIDNQIEYPLGSIFLKNNIAYCPPELTGRVSQRGCFQSDLYSLGIIFYEVLSGAPPFSSADSSELLFNQLTTIPETLQQRQELPTPLSNIVKCLLEKSIKNRYQRAFGLKRDLLRLKSELDSTGQFTVSPLTGIQISDRIRFADDFIGRELELKKLNQEYRLALSGRSRVVLIEGSQGVGKNKLIKRFIQGVSENKFYFKRIHVSHNVQQIPYGLITESLNEIIDRSLAEPEELIQQLATQVIKELRSNFREIYSHLPRLKLLLKDFPVSVSKTGDSTFSLKKSLVGLYRIFADKEHPVILHIDDYHRLDDKSLSIIQEILTGHPQVSILLIGTTSIVKKKKNQSGPLSDLVNLAERNMSRLRLGPLPHSSINQWIAEKLFREPRDCERLTDQIIEKTHGIPYFLNHFIDSLVEKKLIRLDSDTLTFTWDINAVQACPTPDDIAAILVSKFDQLPSGTRKLLRIAACIGMDFTLETILKIGPWQQSSIEEVITPAVDRGLLHRSSDLSSIGVFSQFSFAHPRIQSVIYESIEPKEKQKTHLAIGYTMLNGALAPYNESNQTFIVEHLNAGAGAIQTLDEKINLATLNLAIFRTAWKIRSTHTAAGKWAEQAYQLLPVSCWESHRELMMEVTLASCDALDSSNQLDEIKKRLNFAFQHTKKDKERWMLAKYLVRVHWAQQNGAELEEALDKSLKYNGSHFPEDDKALNRSLKAGLKAVRHGFSELPIENDNPFQEILTNPLRISWIQFIAYSAVVVLFGTGKRKKSLYMLLEGLSITLREGYCEYTSCLVILFAASERILGKHDSASRLGQLAIELASKENEHIQSFVYTYFAIFIIHWEKSLDESEKYLSKVLEIGEKNLSDPRSLVFQFSDKIRINILQGKNLGDLQKEIKAWFATAPGLEYSYLIEEVNVISLRLIEALTAPNPPKIDLDRDYSERPILMDKPSFFINRRGIQFHFDLLFLFLCGTTEQKIRFVQNFDHLRPYFSANFHFAPTVFLVALVYLEGCHSASPEEKAGFIKLISSLRAMIYRWKRKNPAEYTHRINVIDAELCRISGAHVDAMRFYDEAIIEVKNTRYRYEEAILNELAGRFYLKIGLPRKSFIYLNEARHRYRLWGANVKSDQLSKQYEKIFTRFIPSKKQISDIVGDEFIERIDFKTILNASQAISSETNLEMLIRKLLNIIMTNAAAHKAVLIFSSNHDLQIKAIGNSSDGSVTHIDKSLGKTNTHLPVPVIQFVKRTGDSLLIHDLSMDNRFHDDPYLKKNSTKSILCLPIIRKEEMLAILYLENNLSTHIFSTHRQEILKILCAQAAISMENAAMISSLTEEISARARIEKELRASEQKYRVVTDNSEDVIWTFDADFHLTFVTPSISKLLGYTPNEIKVMNIRDLILPSSISSRKAMFDEAMANAKSGEDLVFSVEIEFRRKDGSSVWTENREKVFIDPKGKEAGSLIATRDISSRKVNEDKLKAYREHLEELIQERTDSLERINFALAQTEIRNQTLFKNSPGYIINLDRNYHILFQSRPFFRNEDIQPHGKNLFDVIKVHDEEGAQKAIDATFQNSDISPFETLVSLPDGSSFWMEVRFAPILQNDQIDEIVLIATDVSQRKFAEQELEKAQADLVEKAHRAGMADIAAGVLHNVGNILNSVKTSSHVIHTSITQPVYDKFFQANTLLREQENNLTEFFSTDDRAKKLVRYYLKLEEAFTSENQKLRENIRRLNDKVDAITNVITAQQSYAGMSQMIEKATLSEIIEDALTMQTDSLTKYGITIEKYFDMLPDVPVNKTKLVHILINLINNAKEAMKLMQKEEKRLEIKLFKDSNAAVIQLSDTGYGISPENLKRIFTAGFTTKDYGHGFGLHSCALYMEEMRGEIKAESDGIDKGALFTLKLPFETSPEKDATVEIQPD